MTVAMLVNVAVILQLYELYYLSLCMTLYW